MTESQAANITFHRPHVSRQDKERLLGQKGMLLWFTGMSAAGKSTIAHALESELFSRGRMTVVLDGDNVRHGLNKDLGFSKADREENIRRISEVAKLFVENGLIVMTAFISPYLADRDRVRSYMGGDFVEIYVKCPMEELERRDPKGIYKKARAGAIDDFTGITAPYEEPPCPELTLDTSLMPVRECVKGLMNYLDSHYNRADMVKL
ncbi:MAG: adenylyl-sulfate kinase [Nitrospirae bacterium]|nr:MAG: adenylyl-sulfate kinase [Nitrospirota bacterium]